MNNLIKNSCYNDYRNICLLNGTRTVALCFECFKNGNIFEGDDTPEQRNIFKSMEKRELPDFFAPLVSYDYSRESSLYRNIITEYFGLTP